MATPFVQGRLRRAALTVRIDSSCASCRRALVIDVSDSLDRQVVRAPAGEGILVFEPSVDWSRFTAPTIVHDY